MPYKVLLSRELPLPPLSLDGKPIEICVYQNGGQGYENAQVYCTTGLDKVDVTLINALPDSIGLIANIGVGTDNIDFTAAQAKGIAVSNTPVVTEDTADLAFALILSACRRMTANESFARSGQWSQTLPHSALGQSVHGKTLGILGFGTIGQAVAIRAQGFGMTVIYHGPSRKPEAEAKHNAQYQADLQTFLAQIDILTLHCSLTEHTRHILNTGNLTKLQKGAVIVNTGRGALIDESALLEALKSGHIGAAGLDVFENEPDIHPEFLKLDNVTLTPHIGSATNECRTRMAMRAIGNIMNFLKHGKPIDVVVK